MFRSCLPSLFVLALQVAATHSSNYLDVSAEPATSCVTSDAATKHNETFVGHGKTELHNLELRSSCTRNGCADGYVCFSYCGCCPRLDGCYKPLSGPYANQWGCYSSPPGEIVSVVTESGSAKTSALSYTPSTRYTTDTTTSRFVSASTAIVSQLTSIYGSVPSSSSSSSSSSPPEVLASTTLSYRTTETEMVTGTYSRSESTAAWTQPSSSSYTGALQARAAHSVVRLWQMLTVLSLLGASIVYTAL